MRPKDTPDFILVDGAKKAWCACLGIRRSIYARAFIRTLYSRLYPFQEIDALPFTTGWVCMVEEILFKKPLGCALVSWDPIATTSCVQDIPYEP
jgi:hypothetical protein